MADTSNAIADVVVVGSGFAGLSAAIAASQAGASVIVLEKENSLGGNSVVSGGTLTVVGSPIQAREGIQDSFSLLKSDMCQAGEQRNNPGLVQQVIEQSYPTFEWLTNELGVKFKDRVDQYGGHSVPRNHTPQDVSGAAMITALLTKAKQLGVEIRTQTRLSKLLVNSQRDTHPILTGVEVQTTKPSAPIQQINVNQGVVLATGGFSGDTGFRQQYAPHLPPNLDHTNVPNTSAEALVEAIRIGAQCLDLDQIQLAPWVSPDETGYGIAPLFASYTVLAYGLAVDPATGKRFINELADRKRWTDKLLEIGHPCIGIADTVGMQNSGIDIEPDLDRGVVKKFETLSSLASTYQIPLEALDSTIRRYNSFVEQHQDPEFGKFIRDYAKPLSSPFYGVRLWPKVHYTMGGLKIDVRGRVLGKGDRPIIGLYAAGEVTGGIHGACRLGGCAITECLVFGRIAGREAATHTQVPS
ncbi:MAG: flavocytochrome c [Moorea sp. SIOASIH]|uniref:flavocytochrome c n=1 Tax=Moorena sp. SIOASIH TaxID=2607817 RepID=UPI0013B69F7E|nr:flavocytochrome c [Moorena sp. SIOASIH]NEO39760.1 flavocytochrome c [Moorena sp. SIOASIH]